MNLKEPRNTSQGLTLTLDLKLKSSHGFFTPSRGLNQISQLRHAASDFIEIPSNMEGEMTFFNGQLESKKLYDGLKDLNLECDFQPLGEIWIEDSKSRLPWSFSP